MPAQVTFSGGGLSVVALLGEDGALVTSGYGGWSLVGRPRRASITSWDGQKPLEMSVSIILDGYVTDTSVEVSCLRLEKMAFPVAPYKEPPTVRVSGPIPHTDKVWVIDGIDWLAALRSKRGYRIRQAASVKLLRYVAEDRLQVSGASQTARDVSSAGIGKSYVVKASDSLTSIANQMYGDGTQWKKIADANNIRDPKNIVPGTTLRIP